MYINSMKISTRLYAAFGFVILLMLGTMGIAIYGMARMDAASDEVTTNAMPSIEQANIMNTRASDIRVLESLHVLNTDEKKMAAIEVELAKELAEFEKAHQAYIPLIGSPAERAVYQAMLPDWQKYMEKMQVVLGHSRKGENEAAQDKLQNESKALYEKATEGIQAIVDFNQKAGYVAAKDSKATYHQARQTIVGMGLVAVLVACIMSTLLIRSVTMPLRKAVEVAESVAQGDLTHDIFTLAQDETGVLMRALHRMQTHLVQSVSGVRQNAMKVSDASAEIAQGNMDLSARTESQASSLEQTAASMEQLSAQVKQNADSAREASNLASNASTVATRGGEVMGRVVTTMKEINDSSRRISDIISVIDGIAFQTNILALNAAVEAARAGDQGRGFAVVASEVRSLAGRSADAAKEIKTLISASVNRVEQGTALVDEAGSTMGEVVSSIKRVTDLVSEINSSSREQAAGVAQAGEAVSQMDQVTQQNASMVEEMANAAANLKSQAHELVETVSVFKLEKNESRQRLLAS